MRISDWSSDVCSSDLLTALWKVMPALVAGNTVVLRPSPLTPLSAMLFADAANEAELPAGVLNIVLEAGIEGGRLLSTHPDVDMFAFTGSTAVGPQVLVQAAATMTRLQLELGGKSAGSKERRVGREWVRRGRYRGGA